MDLSMDSGAYKDNDVSMSQNKRANKPLVERKRRVRINKSIEELKAIVLQAMNKDDKDYCKMEKADILEMVVRHLRAIRRNQLAAESMRDPGPMWNNYRVGFNECAAEVMTYMRDVDGVDHSIQLRMLQHLSNCVQHINTYPADVTNTSQNVVNQRAPIQMTSHNLKTQFIPQPVGAGIGSVGMLKVPSTTPEASLPGSPSLSTIKQEVTSSSHERLQRHSPINFSKPHYAAAPTAVDQIVPGSQSPDVDYYANDSFSMVTESKDKRSSPNSSYGPYHLNEKDFYRQHELKLKMKVTVKPRLQQREHALHASQCSSSSNVWRPW